MTEKQKQNPVDAKTRDKRGLEIVSLALALVAFGAYGYGHFMATPAYKSALARDKSAMTAYSEATARQKSKRKGKKGPDSPEVKTARDGMLVIGAEKDAAMLRVGVTATITLVLGFFGFIVGFVGLTKTKWTAAKLGKRLRERVFGIASLAVGSGGLYLGVRLLSTIS